MLGKSKINFVLLSTYSYFCAMEHASPILTVVVPVFDREKLFAEMLASLSEQTARGFELVIVDNASTDGSRAVAEAWAVENQDISVKIVCEPRHGAPYARNRGLAEVRTEWTLFFDSDDLMLPGHIARVLDAIGRHPDADVVGWNTTMADGPDKGRLHVFTAHKGDSWWDLLFRCTFSTQRYCARTRVFTGAGEWRESIRLWQDMELGARILASGPRIVSLGGPATVVMRRTAESITGMDYVRMTELMEPALESVAAVMPSEKRYYCDIKRAIMYGYADRECPGRCRALLKALKGRQDGRGLKLVLQLVYSLYSRGVRGGARIVKPICRCLDL